MDFSNSEPANIATHKTRPSTLWYAALGVLLVINLLMWLSGGFGVLVTALFSVLSLAALAAGNSVQKYRRIVFVIVIPGLLSWIAATYGFYVAFNNGYGGLATQIFQSVASASTGNSILAALLGLLIGILVPIGILECYVFLHQAAVEAFTGLDAKTARRALRSLVLNVNYPYYIIEDGKSTVSRPAGIFPKWGGPGKAIIRAGNAVVFQQGGKLSHIALSGVYVTKRFERIYKIINLTSRDNLSPPAQPGPATPQPSPQTALQIPGKTKEAPRKDREKSRNVRNVLTRDRIALDLDLKVFFRLKRKTEPKQDPTLLAFSSTQADDLPEAYPVDPGDVYRVATTVNNWEAAVPHVAEDILRDVIGQTTLDDLFTTQNHTDPPQIRGRVCQEIKERLNGIVEHWGVVVTDVSIGEIDVPQDVQEQLKRDWLLKKQNALFVQQSEAQARAYEEIESARLKVQTSMLRSIREILEDTGTEAEYSSNVILSLVSSRCSKTLPVTQPQGRCFPLAYRSRTWRSSECSCSQPHPPIHRKRETRTGNLDRFCPAVRSDGAMNNRPLPVFV